MDHIINILLLWICFIVFFRIANSNPKRPIIRTEVLYHKTNKTIVRYHITFLGKIVYDKSQKIFSHEDMVILWTIYGLNFLIGMNVIIYD